MYGYNMKQSLYGLKKKTIYDTVEWMPQPHLNKGR